MERLVEMFFYGQDLINELALNNINNLKSGAEEQGLAEDQIAFAIKPQQSVVLALKAN